MTLQKDRITLKQCSRCDRWKPATPESFPRQGDWLNAWCRDCHVEYAREKRADRRLALGVPERHRYGVTA